MEKILATFRIDVNAWEAFKDLAAKNDTTATALLTEFVRQQVSGNIDTHIDSHIDSHIDTHIDDNLANRIDTIEESLYSLSTFDLDAHIDKLLDSRLDAIRKEMVELREKLNAR